MAIKMWHVFFSNFVDDNISKEQESYKNFLVNTCHLDSKVHVYKKLSEPRN